VCRELARENGLVVNKACANATVCLLSQTSKQESCFAAANAHEFCESDTVKRQKPLDQPEARCRAQFPRQSARCFALAKLEAQTCFALAKLETQTCFALATT
jgi:hypothetical protein